MNVKEAAEYLSARGYRCGAGTVRALARAGRLKHYRPGVGSKGRIAFNAGQLDAFLRAAEVGGADAPPAPAPEVAPKPAAERKPRPPAPPTPAKAPGGDWRARYAKVRGA